MKIIGFVKHSSTKDDLCSSTLTKTPFITPGKFGWREIKNETVIVMNLPLAVEKRTFKKYFEVSSGKLKTV